MSYCQIEKDGNAGQSQWSAEGTGGIKKWGLDNEVQDVFLMSCSFHFCCASGDESQRTCSSETLLLIRGSTMHLRRS